MKGLLKLRLSLLGAPLIEANGAPVEFKRRKATALLAYLAVNDDKLRRELLATLFWAELDEERARTALRQVIWEINGTPFQNCLQINRETIYLYKSTNLTVDVRRFRELIAQAREHQHPPAKACQECLRNLTEAAQLYRGDFLAGFTLRNGSAEFDEWQFLQSESLRNDAVQALTQLVFLHEARADYNAAIVYAQQLLTLDTTNEATYQQLMRFYAATNQRTAALRCYVACVKRLQQELNESPHPETTRLYQAIKAGSVLVSEATASTNSAAENAIAVEAPKLPSQLPPETTPFFGREPELEKVTELLANCECRLLTVLGAGGIGKTRLAIEAAKQHLQMFRDGVAFVSLAAVSSPAMLVSAIADALGVPIHGQAEMKAQLLDFLRGKQCLLVLDNFEHLVDGGAEILAEVLQKVETLKLLVTSRERVNLRTEWLLELEGLSFPGNDLSADFETYSAVQLFLQAAKRTDAKFALREETRASIARICRVVEGLPLGIELAASWVHALSCQQIAAELERSLDLLTTTLRDVPAEHRSMRAVFERSWSFLSEEQQRALRMMSVFRGGFELEAAKFVANVGLATLSALVDKSLLRRTRAERYEMHELIRQFAAEKLHELFDEEHSAHDLHCTYYSKRFDENAENDINQRLEVWEESENARTGWQWAVEHTRTEEIERYLNAIFHLYELRGWYQEGYVSFAAAASNLCSLKNGLERRHQSLLGKLTARQGAFCSLMGHLQEGEKLLRQALNYLRDAELPEEHARCLNRLGIIVYHQGNHAEGKKLVQDALALYREAGNQQGIAQSLGRLGYIANANKEHSEAERLLEESLKINRLLKRKHDQISLLHDYGYALYHNGKYERAAELFKESLILSRAVGYRRAVAAALINLGEMTAAVSEFSGARQYFDEALTISIEIQALSFALETLVGIASLLARESGKEKQVVQLAAFALNHPASFGETKETAQNLLLKLETELPSDDFTFAAEEAKRLTIEDLIASLD